METAGKPGRRRGVARGDEGLGNRHAGEARAIIERLIDVGYVERDGRALVATEKGLNVIRLLGEHALTSPDLTGSWEHRLGRIDPLGTEVPECGPEILDHLDSILIAPIYCHMGILPHISSLVIIPAYHPWPAGPLRGPISLSQCRAPRRLSRRTLSDPKVALMGIPGHAMGGGRGGACAGMRSLRRDRSILQHRVKKGTARRMLAFAVPYKKILAIFLPVVVLDAVSARSTR